jgi:hypothetical protein
MRPRTNASFAESKLPEEVEIDLIMNRKANGKYESANLLAWLP